MERRSIFDRRQFSYTFHLPERRSEVERRAEDERRSGDELKNQSDIRTENNERRGKIALK